MYQKSDSQNATETQKLSAVGPNFPIHVHFNIDSPNADQIVPFQNRGLSFAIPFSDMQ